MIPACLTTLLWSFCIVASRRSIEQLGENAANFWRILMAVVCLGTLSHATGAVFTPGAFGFFFLSGVLGFGLGDIGLYFALSRIGSRLTVLLAQCAAVPIAFAVEWSWLGTTIGWGDALAITVVVAGIVLALLPDRSVLPTGGWGRFLVGVGFGLVAAVGQGLGGVLSRKAFELEGQLVEGLQRGVGDSILLGAAAGYQRLLGGVLIVAAVYFAGRLYAPWRTAPTGPRKGDAVARKASWVALNAFTGPIVGIIFFQWALATTPAAIVQSIVALTPVTVIPLAWWLEGDRPRPRSLLGGVIAVGGVILLGVL